MQSDWDKGEEIKGMTEEEKKVEADRLEKERQKILAAKEQALVGNEIEAMIMMEMKVHQKGPNAQVASMNPEGEIKKSAEDGGMNKANSYKKRKTIKRGNSKKTLTEQP